MCARMTSMPKKTTAPPNRRNPLQILVSWIDDERHPHRAWIPAGNVRRVTDPEGDIEEYDRCPPERRWIRWGDRLPGFLPA